MRTTTTTIMEDINEIEETFVAATEFVRANSGSFIAESLLLLYSRYKQAKEGRCKTARPGFFDFQGKQKWDAWSKLGDMDKRRAMSEYIREVSLVQPDWESQLKSPEKPSKSINQNSLGVAVSTMVNTDNDIDDELKTIFDWCKEGDTGRVSKLLEEDNIQVDAKDEEGMSLLHWACDRGDCDMVDTLIRRKASVNLQIPNAIQFANSIRTYIYMTALHDSSMFLPKDGDGQTALHFAVICEHPAVTRHLLKHGARTDIPDCDEQTVLELETTSEIKNILTSNPVR